MVPENSAPPEPSNSNRMEVLKAENEALRTLDQQRQQAMAFIVHDLRNPLGAISVSLRMLEMGLPKEVAEENHELLEIARANVDRMKRMIESLLEVSRMEDGDHELEIYPVDLGEMIQQAIRRVPSYQRRGMRFEVDIEENLPRVEAEPDKLDRVLANLLENALKFTLPNGLIRIEARLAGDQAAVSITDTGPGIAPEDRERVFDLYAQGDGEKKNRRGYGLGLAYCRLVIEAHGGRIWYEPGPGGTGSRFTFTLPLRQRRS